MVVDLRCPECFLWMQANCSKGDLAELDRAQAASREQMVDAYARSVTDSMETLAELPRAGARARPRRRGRLRAAARGLAARRDAVGAQRAGGQEREAPADARAAAAAGSAPGRGGTATAAPRPRARAGPASAAARAQDRAGPRPRGRPPRSARRARPAPPRTPALARRPPRARPRARRGRAGRRTRRGGDQRRSRTELRLSAFRVDGRADGRDPASTTQGAPEARARPPRRRAPVRQHRRRRRASRGVRRTRRRPTMGPAHQPPATAGRIVTSSPSATGVARPSRKRMSSPLR